MVMSVYEWYILERDNKKPQTIYNKFTLFLSKQVIVAKQNYGMLYIYTKIEEVLLLLLWVLNGLYLLSIVKIHLPFCFRNWKYAPVLKYNSYMQFFLIKYINILIMDTKGKYPILSFGLRSCMEQEVQRLHRSP